MSGQPRQAKPATPVPAVEPVRIAPRLLAGALVVNVCDGCGAVVGDVNAHRRWHGETVP